MELPTEGTWYAVDGKWVPWNEVNGRRIGEMEVRPGLWVTRIYRGKPEYKSTATQEGDYVTLQMPDGSLGRIPANVNRQYRIGTIFYRECNGPWEPPRRIQVLGADDTEGHALTTSYPCFEAEPVETT